MLNKKAKAILFIFIILFFIAAVNAESIDDYTGVESVKIENVKSVNDVVAIEESAEDGNDFSALNATINKENGNSIQLSKNYTYSTEKDQAFKNGINISKTVTIDGKGYTINGNHMARIFNVITGGTLTLKNIILINGNASANNGGAINNGGNSNVTVINSTFINNTAASGGAIYSNKGVDINNSTFINNNATSQGGAIYSSIKAATVTNSNFTNNTAKTAGGAIYSSSTITTTNSTYTNNKATSGSGGAIYGGSDVTIINSKFFNNTGAGSGGGAIYCTGTKGIKVINSTFTNNTLTAGSGGAINSNSKPVNITNSTFTNNYAKSNGGAIYSNTGSVTVTNSKFINNSANAGGVISGSAMNITDSTFINNTAISGTGGAISSSGIINIKSSNFTNNTAKSTSSGGTGGAIHTTKDINITNSNFKQNKAYSTSASGGSGGAIYSNGGVVNITNSTFTENTASATSTGAGYGGGAIRSNKNVNVINSTFTKNTAGYNGGAICTSSGNLNITNSTFNQNSAKNGGAIYSTNCVLNVTNSTFINNTATSSSTNTAYGGGAIFNNKNMTITDSKFINNTAKNSQGGAILSNGAVNIINSTLINNTAKNGGAIYSSSKTAELTVTNSTFDNNSATSGDDIYTASKTTVKGNNYTKDSYANIYAKDVIINGTVVSVFGRINNTYNVTTPDSIFNVNATAFVDGASVAGYDLVISDGVNNYTTSYKGNGSYESEDIYANFKKNSYTAFINNETTKANYTVINATVYNNKHNSTIDVTLDEIVSGKNITGNITIKDANGTKANYTGNITVKIGENSYTVEIVNGTGKLNIENLFEEGNYTVTASFPGSDVYNPSNGTANFTIEKTNPKINLEVSNITYGENETITITLIPSVNGNVTVKIGNDEYIVEIRNGTGKLVLSNLKAGNYTVTAILKGTEEYESTNATANFTVSKRNTKIDLTVSDITYGENETVIISMDPKINGNVTVKIGDDEYVVEVKDGKATLLLIKLKAGNYTVSVVYNGTEEYMSSNATANFTVEKSDSKLEVNVSDIFKGDKETINIIMNPDINGNVTVYINGKNVTVEIKNGQGKLELDNLEVGNYTVTVEFEGDDNYNPSNATGNFTVSKSDYILKVNDLTKYYGNDGRLNITLTDSEGNPLANENVTIIINGKTYTRTTDANGQVHMRINLDMGVYEATVSYKNITKKATVTILSTIEGNDIVKYFRNGTQYYATFYDINGNPLANTNVTFNINGVFYTRTTDENGTAKLNINLNPAEYIITAINPVNNETHSNKVTVLSTIVGEDVVKYYRNGTQYYAIFTDLDGNPLANKSVTFNVHGVFYTRTTDEKGIAQLNINLNPGDYIITAINPVNNETYSNTIKVLNVVETKNLEMSTSDRKPFEVTILGAHGAPLANAEVTFNIHGVFYHKTTDANGKVNLDINLVAGKYIITTYYNDYSVSNTIVVK